MNSKPWDPTRKFHRLSGMDILTPGIYNLTWGAPDYGCLAVDFMVDYWDGCLTITHQTTTEYPSRVSTFVSETPFIVTQEVHTEDNNTITFSGSSAVANGTCLESQLYEGVQPLDAWPTGLCIPVEFWIVACDCNPA